MPTPDLIASIRKTKTLRGAKAIIYFAQRRLDDVRFVGWPLLEQSLSIELEQILAISIERGFDPNLFPVGKKCNVIAVKKRE